MMIGSKSMSWKVAFPVTLSLEYSVSDLSVGPPDLLIFRSISTEASVSGAKKVVTDTTPVRMNKTQ